MYYLFCIFFFCTFFSAFSFFLHFPRFLLTHQLLDIGSPLKNLQYLDQLIQQFYVENPSSTKYRHMSKLTMFMRKSGGPKLRGKAIEIRSFGPAILSLWQQFHNPGLQIHKYILLLLKLNQQIDFVLEEYKGFFSFPANIAEEFNKKNSRWVICKYLWNHILQMKVGPIFSLPLASFMVLHTVAC